MPLAYDTLWAVTKPPPLPVSCTSTNTQSQRLRFNPTRIHVCVCLGSASRQYNSCQCVASGSGSQGLSCGPPPTASHQHHKPAVFGHRVRPIQSGHGTRGGAAEPRQGPTRPARGPVKPTSTLPWVWVYVTSVRNKRQERHHQHTTRHITFTLATRRAPTRVWVVLYLPGGHSRPQSAPATRPKQPAGSTPPGDGQQRPLSLPVAMQQEEGVTTRCAWVQRMWQWHLVSADAGSQYHQPPTHKADGRAWVGRPSSLNHNSLSVENLPGCAGCDCQTAAPAQAPTSHAAAHTHTPTGRPGIPTSTHIICSVHNIEARTKGRMQVLPPGAASYQAQCHSSPVQQRRRP